MRQGARGQTDTLLGRGATSARRLTDLPSVPPPLARVSRTSWRGQIVTSGERILAEEVPVVLTYNGSSHAVMMATPADLEDFAIGFSLSEGVVQSADQIETLEIIPDEQGIELRMFLARPQAERLQGRRRYRAGPTGCGLCGIETLEEALPALRPVESQLRVAADAIRAALHNFALHQQLNQQTHALHAAAFYHSGQTLVLREDVGRHNALDKLVGALARAGIVAESGFVVLSSRVSIEMVQKAAIMATPVVIAFSAPTALAVRACEVAGLTLVAVAREDSFEVFTHPERICGGWSWQSIRPGAKAKSSACVPRRR